MRGKIRLLVMTMVFLTALSSVPAFAQLNFTWGSYLRLRHEYWQNISDMDNGQKNNRNYFRIKTSLWGQLNIDKDYDLYLRFTNEFKAYPYFGGTTGSAADKSATKKGYHFDINEIVVDNLYADVRNFMQMPVDLRLGRQDFIGPTGYGEGFLIADGTPQDGSRTYYFNAAKASWRVNDGNTVDFIYINDPRTDRFLPVINRLRLTPTGAPGRDEVEQQLNTTDEAAGVLYWKNKDLLKNLYLEGYYIYKSEAADGGTGYQAQKGRINTLGFFSKYKFGPYAVRVQPAYQFGSYGNNDRQAEGGYAFLDRDFKDVAWQPSASIGYTYLSGDKRSSGKNEGWDPLFSRYPWYSELYNLSMASETGITAYWTNLTMLRTALVLTPNAKTKLSFWYNYLWANAQVASSAIFSGTGKDRGHLLQAKVDYAFNKNISTYFLAEYLIPGDFYRDNDPAIFLRTELTFKF